MRSPCCGAKMLGPSHSRWCSSCGIAPVEDTQARLYPVPTGATVHGKVRRTHNGYSLLLDGCEYPIGSQHPQPNKED